MMTPWMVLCWLLGIALVVAILVVLIALFRQQH